MYKEESSQTWTTGTASVVLEGTLLSRLPQDSALHPWEDDQQDHTQVLNVRCQRLMNA